MVGYGFKAYITDGMEHYAWKETDTEDGTAFVQSKMFPESLLALLYLDIDKIQPVFDKMDESLGLLFAAKDAQYARAILAELRALTQQEPQPYFLFLYLDWASRLRRAAMDGDFMEELLPRRELSSIPANLKRIQGYIDDLFTHVLDIDGEKQSVEERMTAYYKAAGDKAFPFRPQPMGFELIYGKTFAEVLCPDSLYDMIDYHLRECVKREVKLRRCKNCGRWFAVTGHGGTEYCGRRVDIKGRTCKEIGAVTVWTKNKQNDAVFKVYRREYKKRFAWIKAGHISQEDFYAWSERARAKKELCDSGEMTYDAFAAWLAQS